MENPATEVSDKHFDLECAGVILVSRAVAPGFNLKPNAVATTIKAIIPELPDVGAYPVFYAPEPYVSEMRKYLLPFREPVLKLNVGITAVTVPERDNLIEGLSIRSQKKQRPLQRLILSLVILGKAMEIVVGKDIGLVCLKKPFETHRSPNGTHEIFDRANGFENKYQLGIFAWICFLKPKALPLKILLQRYEFRPEANALSFV
ncbi:hypothetical protein SAMN03159417_00512 [Ralstonia sp. NFACC01]|nr:hypothetical protein SAMN03159417_00512 [Ralstonia sp. NFACC01]